MGIPTLAEMAYIEDHPSCDHYDVIIRRGYAGDVVRDPPGGEVLRAGRDLLFLLDCEDVDGYVLPPCTSMGVMLSNIRDKIECLAGEIGNISYHDPLQFLEAVLTRRIADSMETDPDYARSKVAKLERIHLDRSQWHTPTQGEEDGARESV